MKYLRISILILAIVLIAAGIYIDEVATVINKSINICLECIGIG